MFYLVLGFLFVFLLLGLGILLILRNFYITLAVKEAQMRALASEWLESPNPETPSKFALLIDLVGRTAGQATAKSIMAALNADQSHIARVANGMTDEIQAVQNPILALLKGGKRGKQSAIIQLAEILGSQLMPKGNGQPISDTYQRKHHE